MESKVFVDKKSVYKDDGSSYIIAEIGLNHNGDLELAKKMIKAAAEAGADSAKFQNWKAEDFIADKTQTFTYKSAGKEITESFYEMCKRHEMKPGWIPILRDYCHELGVDFISTPTSKEGVDELIDNGIKVIKNGSDYLGHIPLLKYMGQRAEVVIISTGMAFEDEIQRAVQAVEQGGASVVVLHCTSMYPTPPEDVNIRRMTEISKRLNVDIGFSDHTPCETAAIQAVTLGAKVVEKHFTTDHDLAGPDHWFSSTPDEFKVYVDGIRKAEKNLGSSKIEPAIGEKENVKEFKLSSIAATDLKKGDVLLEEKVCFKKPGTGIPPAFIEEYFGRKLLMDVGAGLPLKSEFFE